MYEEFSLPVRHMLISCALIVYQIITTKCYVLMITNAWNKRIFMSFHELSPRKEAQHSNNQPRQYSFHCNFKRYLSHTEHENGLKRSCASKRFENYSKIGRFNLVVSMKLQSIRTSIGIDSTISYFLLEQVTVFRLSLQ